MNIYIKGEKEELDGLNIELSLVRTPDGIILVAKNTHNKNTCRIITVANSGCVYADDEGDMVGYGVASMKEYKQYRLVGKFNFEGEGG
jgi:hypothetical protein